MKASVKVPATSARYNSALRFIESREFFGMKLGLDNVRDFVEHLGQPQDNFPTVHVAGTNGKGSTVKMLGSILKESGYKTGVFTSPHLVDFRERITINGQKISKTYITNFIERHKPEIKTRQITYFEVMVSLALSYFASRNVDIAIIETGLGGRLDATNILLPITCAISEISLDHTTILGDTLPAIAKEKGGIIKPNVPLALGVMQPSAERTLRRIALKRSSKVVPLVSERILKRYQPSLALVGEHQRDNLRLALTVVSSLRTRGYKLSETNIKCALQKTRWPGRFQIIRNLNGATVILDVAHNETGIDAFVKTFKQKFPERKAYVVAGFVKKKDHSHALKKLLSITASMALTSVKTRRTSDPLELQKITESFNNKNNSPMVTTYKSSQAAFRWCFRQAQPKDLIIVVGSHYLVGEFLRQQDAL